MPALQHMGKYALPVGTAALGGGALGYLAYKLSPERYKRLMGTLGAVVGATAGGYGGYKLLQALADKPQPWLTPKGNNQKERATFPESSTPETTHPADATPQDLDLARSTVHGVLANDTQAAEKEQAAADLRNSPTTAVGKLIVRPRYEGFKAAFNNPDNVVPITNPAYWGYRALGTVTEPIVNAIPGDSLAAESAKSGVNALGFSGYSTLLKYGPKIPGVGKVAPILSPLGKASDMATAAINTVKDIGKGLDDRRMRARASHDAAEIQQHLPENATPVQTFLYSVHRKATEKALQTTAAGLSLSPVNTGGMVSAMGLNNAIPLSETIAVGKEVLRHAKPAQSERERLENEGMLANLGNLTKDMSLPNAWLKAMSMGHGTDKMERERIEAENKIHARPVDIAATQRNITRMRNEVLRERPDIAQGIRSENATSRQLATRQLNHELSKKVQRMTPVTHTTKTLKDRIRGALGLRGNNTVRVTSNGQPVADIPTKTLLSEASRQKYGFDIFQ